MHSGMFANYAQLTYYIPRREGGEVERERERINRKKEEKRRQERGEGLGQKGVAAGVL